MNELLEQQLKNIKKVKRPPVQIGISYNATLQQLVREIKKDINEQLVPLLRQLSPQYAKDASIVTHDAYLFDITNMLQRILEKWTSPAFRYIGERIARQFVTTADQVNAKRFGIDVLGNSVDMTTYIEASIYDNTNLITSIPQQYLKNVESIVMTNVRSGNRSTAIVKSLVEQFGVTERRAKMIARDQTAKLNGQLSEKRQVGAGFNYFRWMDSDDSRVRDRHESIANKITAYGKGIYRWDNPPLSDKGVPIIPGEDYQCRCFPQPVSDEEVAENVRKGLTDPNVKR